MRPVRVDCRKVIVGKALTPVDVAAAVRQICLAKVPTIQAIRRCRRF